MNESLLQFGLTAFTMLLVVINPVAVAPIFVAVTSTMSLPQRRSTLTRAVLSSFSVAMFFLLVGQAFLSYMGVSVHAFSISGGILLFTLAFPMLMGQRSSLQSSKRDGENPAGEDVAFFPLTIPQLAGPGTIATVLLLSTQAAGDLVKLGILVITIAVIYLISWPTLYMAERLMNRLGEGRMHVITRILGLVLAALAVQYVLNGISGFYASIK